LQRQQQQQQQQFGAAAAQQFGGLGNLAGAHGAAADQAACTYLLVTHWLPWWLQQNLGASCATLVLLASFSR
jgi:hypothetical protein